MKILVVASGSKGNATLIYHKDHVILVDMGISKKLLSESISSNTDFSIKNIKGVIITHEHSDHILGLSKTKVYLDDILKKAKENKINSFVVDTLFDKASRIDKIDILKYLGDEEAISLLKINPICLEEFKSWPEIVDKSIQQLYKLFDGVDSTDIFNVYASKGTLSIKKENILYPYKTVVIDGFNITPISTSHDAFNPLGFIISIDGETLVYVTDTGYISDRNLELLKNADYYIIESNHDIQMLLKTKRPPDLIQRILGDVGHLSNTDSALYMAKLIGDKTKEVILAHISEEANTPELALKTHLKIYQKNYIDFDKINVHCAKQYECVIGGNENEN